MNQVLRLREPVFTLRKVLSTANASEVTVLIGTMQPSSGQLPALRFAAVIVTAEALRLYLFLPAASMALLIALFTPANFPLNSLAPLNAAASAAFCSSVLAT